MSLIDFENLAHERPDLEPAWLEISAWIKHHPSARAIDPARIARERAVSDLPMLAEAFRVLHRDGLVSRSFRIETPDGNLVGDFPDPNDVPERVQDTAGHWFDTRDGRLVVVFREAANAE